MPESKVYTIPTIRYTIIYHHGNATDVGELVDYAKYISDTTNSNIIIYDYPGYGYSNGKINRKSQGVQLRQIYITVQVKFMILS